MDSNIFNEDQEELKEDVQDIEQEEKEKDSGEEENPMPEDMDSENEEEETSGEGDEEYDEEEDEDEETEGGEAEGEEQEGEDKLDRFTNKAYGFADKAFDKGMGLASRAAKGIYNTKLYKVVDGFKNVKDNATYNMRNAIGKMKTGVASVKKSIKEKAANSKFGKWITKKKEEKAAKKAAEAELPKEPGIFSRLWTNLKTGVAAAKKKVQNSKFAKGVRKAEEKLTNNPVVNWAKTGVATVKSKLSESKAGKWIATKMEERAAKKAAEKERKAAEKAEKERKKAAEKAEKERKKAEEAAKPKKPGFFARTFDKIKTGVSSVVDKAKNTKVGKMVTREAGKASSWIKDKKNKIKAVKKEFDAAGVAHEHERRMANLGRKDPDYKSRYDALVAELKNNPGIQDLQGSISRKDLERLLDKWESGEGGSSKKNIADKAGGAVKGLASGVAKLPKLKKSLTKGAQTASSHMGAVGSGIKMVSDFTKAGMAKHKEGQLRDLAKAPNMKNNQLHGRILQQGINQANKEAVDNSFAGVEDMLEGVESLTKYVPGAGQIIKQAAKGGKFVTGVINKMVDADIQKDSEKKSMKGILGGTDTYIKLKAKYKLKAPEMRNAVREAVGLQTNGDVLNADRANMATQLASEIQNGDGEATTLGKTLTGSDKKMTDVDFFQGMGGSLA